jgi:hypothetical protein
MWGVPFAALFGLVVARNTFLFSTRLYEQGDSSANSILIEQALRFRLLVGNYSREGFNHPGPAYMYAQAFGEWLARDMLHIVPTPWNGQLLAVYALDSGLAALAVFIVYGWTRSVKGAASAFVVILGFGAMHPEVLTSNWMPDLYVMAFFVFLLAAASVAARQARDIWVLAVTGWLLIHGHVCFLFFVPVMTAAAVLIAFWPRRRHPLAAVRKFVRDHRGAWIPAVVISAVFVTPIAINLLLHWPGSFAKYFAYGKSGKSGHRTGAEIMRYALWYWWPHHFAWAVPLALFVVALTATALLTRDRLRRCLFSVLAMTAVASLAFVVYVALGIDELDQVYIGYFYWSVPFAVLMVIAVSLVQAVRVRLTTAVVLLGAAAVTTAFAFLGGLRTDVVDNNPQLPGAVTTLATVSHGRPIVIAVHGMAWVEAPGFLVQAERTGVRTCVDQPGNMAFVLTSQFVCTSREESVGVRYEFLATDPPRRTRVITRFGTPMFGYTLVIAG